MSIVPVTIRGLVDGQDLGPHLRATPLAGVMPALVIYSATKDYGTIQVQVISKDHVLVSGPLEASVCDDVHGPSHHQGPQ